MDENTPKRTSLPDEEFDIEVLFSKLNRINRKICHRLMYPFRLLLFNIRFLAVTLFICAVLSVILRFTLPKIYSASFIYEPTLKSDMFHLNLLADLDALFKEDNEDHAADLLNLDKHTANQIKRIFHLVHFKNEYKKDSIMSVEVEMLAEDNSVFDTLQQSILHYLMKSPHYLKLLEIRKLELNTMEEKLLQDIEYNDSLKRTLAANAIPRGNGGFVYGEPIDPVRVNESGINLVQRLISVRSQKQFINNFELVKPVVIKKKPYFPRFIILLPVLCAIGLIVVCVINYKKMNVG